MHTALSAFLHSAHWEEFLRATGQTVERTPEGLYVRGSLPNRGSYWRGSRITIDATWSPPTFSKDAWFLRLEPLAAADAVLSKFGKIRTTDSVQPKQTMVLDLQKSEEELLGAMKSKHRYNIRVAERYKVAVELYHHDAASHFDRFWDLLSETASRHDFRTHARDYYKTMIETLAPLGEAHLGFASIGGSDAATILLITHESVVTYLHGGSAKVHREVMAPFLLHWQAIQWAKQADYKVYDFWGTNAVQKDDTWEPLPNHASTGTTRFKLGFGGEVVQFPGAVDLVLKPIPYTLYRTMRRIIRRQSSF